MFRRVALAVLLVCGPGLYAGAAQAPASCDGRACPPADLWAGVNEIHEIKNAFVAALRQFAESASGSYGDEGALLPAQLDALQRAVDSWDRAIAIYEAATRAASGTADAHLALGSVYLDRLRGQDAAREFAAAARLDPRRGETLQMIATAADFAKDARTALDALEKAHAAAPADAATMYRLSVALLESDRPSRAGEVQRRIDGTHPTAPPGAGGGPAVVFERVGLLRQAAGVAPILPPQIYVGGFRLIEAGDLVAGVAQLRQAMSSDPLLTGTASSAARPAGTRLRVGQLQAALSSLRVSVAQSPDAESQRVAGVAYWADEQYDKSIEALTAAAALNPRDERSLIALADVFMAANQAPAAERTLKAIIDLLPDSGQAHYRLGRLYQTATRVADAVQEYEKAVECAPLTGLDYLFEVIGGLYATQADFTHTASAYRRRVDVNPNNAEAHRKLGEIYALQGEHDAALAEFAVARWLDPKDADAYAGSSQVYLRMERFADAASSSRAALALDPRHQKARFALGAALARLGDTEGGQREFAIFQRQTDATAFLRRRSLEAETLASDAARSEADGNHSAAVSLLQRALEAAPDDARLEFQLSSALLKAGRSEDALAQLARLRALGDDAEIHKLAGEAYAALGQTDARQREELLYFQLLAERKQQRLKERPLLR